MAIPGRDAANGPRRFHLAAWRWHFYAGVGVLPIVLVLAISGLAMLAGEPIDRLLNRDLLTVTADDRPLPPSAQAASVAAAYPDAELATFYFSSTPEASTRIDAVPSHASGHGSHTQPESLAVFVDPRDATVLGTLDANRGVYAWAKALHGTLLLGTAGDYLIEIAAGFGILLLCSGVYLWWPREPRRLRESLLPTLAGGGRRRWRDLHAAVGVWVAPFLLFFFASGLAWTPFWGGELVQTWSSLPGETFDAPLSKARHESLNHGAHRDVPWTLEQTPLPASGSTRGSAGVVANRPIGLDDVVTYARRAGFSSARVHWPRGDDGVWTIARTTIGGDTRDPTGDRIVHLDAISGNVLAEVRFADYSPMGKFMAAGVPLHQADSGGLNVALNVLVCLAVLALSAAGIAAWWSRRPRGARRLVPPPLPQDVRAWRAAVIIMLVLSLAFPLAALTIAAVLALDLLVLSRIPKLRELFS